jgi:hypothetical protein
LRDSTKPRNTVSRLVGTFHRANWSAFEFDQSSFKPSSIRIRGTGYFIPGI